MAVDPGEDFVLCTAELAPVAAECIRAAAKAGTVVHGFQIEAGIQRTAVGATAGRPVEA